MNNHTGHLNGDANNPDLRLVGAEHDAQTVVIAAAADALAAADRAEPGVGFENRIAMLAADEAARAMRERGVIRVRAMTWVSRVRIAAAVALLARAGLTWMALRPASATTKPETLAEKTVADEWLFAAMKFDDNTGAEIDLLMNDAATLDSNIRRGWSTDGMLEGGAM